MSSSETFKTLVTEVFPDGKWQGAVALNQLFYLTDAHSAESWGDMEARIRKFLDVWNRNPINLSAFLVTWRMRSIELHANPMDILDALEYDPSKPSYFDPERNNTSVDFFLGILSEDYGMDVSKLVATVRDALGDERYVNDFLRLVDIDMPLEPEAFVKRVEEAINVILKAREQGLDVGKILEVWDGMAEGGERLEKLADAVRAVAEEEVRKKFWEEVRNAFSELGIQVFPDEATNNLFTKAYYSELVDVNNGKVDISGLREVIQRVAPLLKKIRPIPLYRTKEIENILERVGVGSTNPLDIISVLEKLPRLPLNVFFETELWSYVVEGIRKAKDDPNLPERLATVLRDIAEGNIERGDDVIRMLVPD